MNLMRTVRMALAVGAILGSMTVGSATAASATGSTGPGPTLLAGCNMATSFWYARPWFSYLVPTFDGDKNCLMREGAENDGVRQLQLALRDCHGVNTGDADGVYGWGTRNAVITLQRTAGVPENGVYDYSQLSTVIRWRLLDQNGNPNGGCREPA